MKEYFRGVLWPREPTKDGDKVNYRYVVVGMLVTDKPIDLPEEFLNEAVLDGSVKMAEAIEEMSKRHTKLPLGDASDVLVSLDMI